MDCILTVKEVNSIRLEEGVREFEHLPEVGRDAAQLVGERIDEVVHVVEQVWGIVSAFGDLQNTSTDSYRGICSPTSARRWV